MTEHKIEHAGFQRSQHIMLLMLGVLRCDFGYRKELRRKKSEVRIQNSEWGGDHPSVDSGFWIHPSGLRLSAVENGCRAVRFEIHAILAWI
jgi:hypothetical protein